MNNSMRVDEIENINKELDRILKCERFDNRMLQIDLSCVHDRIKQWLLDRRNEHER